MIKKIFQLTVIILIGLAAYYGFYNQKNHPVKSAKAAGITYYVATTGSDTTGTGSSASPWKTIQKAANMVNPGDTVIVRDGTYYSTVTNMVLITRGGVAGSPVTFRAEHKWGAVLDGTNNTGTFGFVIGDTTHPVSYVTIEDFEITKFKGTGISSNQAGNHHLTFRRLHIHHVGNILSDSSGGLGGIFTGPTLTPASSHDILFDSNLIHDIGRTGTILEDPETLMNHDHGIYNCAYNVTVINNIIYNCKAGVGYMESDYGPPFTHDILVANNTFAFAGTVGYQQCLVHLGTNSANTLFENNILYHTDSYNDHSAISWSNPDIATDNNVVLRNNVTDAVRLADRMMGGGKALYPWVVQVNNMVSTDPLFVSAALPYDFHLQAGSPAINTGIADRAPTVDYEGNSRPQGAGFDIGAYEYVTSLTPNITFSKAVDKTSAKSGDIITYTLTYSNTGTAAATTAKIEDLLPTGTTFVSASNSGTLTSGKVTWNLGTIAAGVSNATVTFQVKVN